MDRKFVEDENEMKQLDQEGWVCEPCEGGWMCFVYTTDAEQWENQQ